MTQEEKELWLKDLCARVPYHPKGRVVNNINGAECEEYLTCATFSMFTIVHNNSRLYLRPMSSMTEEEKDEYYKYYDYYNNEIYACWDAIDWLNAHHFDYRDLISMGLALEAPEDMYKINNEEV